MVTFPSSNMKIFRLAETGNPCSQENDPAHVAGNVIRDLDQCGYGADQVKPYHSQLNTVRWFPFIN